MNWIDVNDDEVDDQFYENHQMQAPLCSTAWSYKESCDKTCQKTGLEPKTKEGWNTADKILLAILTLFGTFLENNTSLFEITVLTHNPTTLSLYITRSWNVGCHSSETKENV